MGLICVLCGLEIPKGKESIDHYCCKHRFPRRIWDNPKNKVPAFYMLNAIKSDYLPCEFFEMKYDLTYNALKNWRIQEEDKEFLERALVNWKTYDIDPCALCLAKCNEKGR